MEVQCLSVVDHPNLVKLLGYCSVENERGVQLLLVYEFMSNRSLDDHLFNRALPTLPWKTRLEIILGAAEGLAYLHEVMEPKVQLMANAIKLVDNMIVSGAIRLFFCCLNT